MLQVVGVAHETWHPDYPRVLEYLDKNITSESRVALESKHSLEELLGIVSSPRKRVTLADVPSKYKKYFSEEFFTLFPFTSEAGNVGFFAEIARYLQKKGAAITTVENKIRLREEHCLDWLRTINDGGLSLEQHATEQISLFKRSQSMYRQAKAWRATHLIVGNTHGYDLQQAYGLPTILITDIHKKKERDRVIELFKQGPRQLTNAPYLKAMGWT